MKISHIKNPLTIIAIFAGIAEVSGTTVIAFLLPKQQEVFVWFLVGFPVLLVILFFLTLNFNHKTLYAPSDYQNEDNFLLANKYDFSQQKKVVIKQGKVISKINSEIVLPEKKLEEITNEIYVTNFPKVEEFLKALEQKGYRASSYTPPVGSPTYSDFKMHEAIWLGRRVPVPTAIDVIKAAKKYYPHLKYISISGDGGSNPPDFINDQMYVGGSTETAREQGLKEISQEEINKLNPDMDINELHKIVRNYYKA